jgi:hypothetical protein
VRLCGSHPACKFAGSQRLEHGHAFSDERGHYRIHIEDVYDSVSLSENGTDFGCGSLIELSWERLEAQPEQVHDFFCGGHGSGGIRKELPSTGGAKQ